MKVEDFVQENVMRCTLFKELFWLLYAAFTVGV